MSAKWTNKNEQIRLITECRRSGLSDYQWCRANGILPGTFYNWVSRLKKAGCTVPDPAAQTAALPAVQEVAKLPVAAGVDAGNADSFEEPDAGLPTLYRCPAAAEIESGKILIRLYNGADPGIVQAVLQHMGGAAHAR